MSYSKNTWSEEWDPPALTAWEARSALSLQGVDRNQMSNTQIYSHTYYAEQVHKMQSVQKRSGKRNPLILDQQC